LRTTIAALLVSAGVAWFITAITVLAVPVIPIGIACGLLCVVRGALPARPWR
jgi:hypothetical protein